MDLKRVYFKVSGKVQGIGFRWFVQSTAQTLLLTGWIRNVIDGSVEGEVQGTNSKVALFLADIKAKHIWAGVKNIEIETRQTLDEKEFIIRPTI
ncbi:MAG: acylphosphatase [Elusimicrobia bacterium]|nr:acylphosphatase [Elusimicrobiota bacterium]